MDNLSLITQLLQNVASKFKSEVQFLKT